MKTKNEIISFLLRNNKHLREQFHLSKIGFFGSYARGEQRYDSDLDLIVEFEDNTQNLYELKQALKEFFRKNLALEVDICREKYIKQRIKESIMNEAVFIN
jgi:uncharacterized protein